MEDDCEERIAAAESLAQLQKGAYLQSSFNNNNSQLQVFVEPTPLDHEFYEYEVFRGEPTQKSKLSQQHISTPNIQVVTYIDPTNEKTLDRDMSEYYKMPLGIKDPREAITWDIRRVEWEGRSVMQEFEKIAREHNYMCIIKRGTDNEPL